MLYILVDMMHFTLKLIDQSIEKTVVLACMLLAITPKSTSTV